MAFFGHNPATANPLSRQLFFWSLVCTFFLITGTIIFFSLGYRYAFIEDIFLHTGSINFKSEPRGVNITVDGKKPSARHLNIINNSRHVTGLRHGLHTVEATAEGYKPWSKGIRIRSGLATEFWNVVLIKESYERTPFRVLDPQRLFFTPRNDFLAYPQDIQQGETSLFIPVLDVAADEVLETHEVEFATFTQNSRENLEWSPNTRFIAAPINRTATLAHDDIEIAVTAESQLLTDAQKSAIETAFIRTPLKATLKDYAIIDRDKDEADVPLRKKEPLYLSSLIADLNTALRKEEILAQLESAIPGDATAIAIDSVLTLGEEPRMLRWHPKQENALLILLGTDLLMFNVGGDVARSEVFAQDVIAYDFADNGIYIITTDGELQWGRDFEPLETEVLREGIVFSENPSVRLIAYDNSRILLIDDTVGSLQVYNDFEDTLVFKTVLDDGLTNVQFSDDGKKFMYQSEKSVSVYFTREWLAQPYRASNTAQNILETEGIITATEWTSDYEHFVVAIGKELYLAELDDRGEYRVEKFLERQIVDENIIIDQRENKLYFTDQATDPIKEGTLGLYNITFPYEKSGLF